MDIGLTDIADTFVDQAHLEVILHPVWRATFDGFGRTLYIALEDHIELFDRTLLHLHIESIQADLTQWCALGYVVSPIPERLFVWQCALLPRLQVDHRPLELREGPKC